MGDHDPAHELGLQLSRIEDTMAQVLTEQQKTNGRLRKVEGKMVEVSEDIYGPSDEQRARHRTGLMARVDEAWAKAEDVARSRDDASAVRGAMRWIIPTCVALLGLMVTAVGLLLQVAGVA